MKKDIYTLKDFKELWINSAKRDEDAFIFGIYTGLLISTFIIGILMIVELILNYIKLN